MTDICSNGANKEQSGYVPRSYRKCFPQSTGLGFHFVKVRVRVRVRDRVRVSVRVRVRVGLG